MIAIKAEFYRGTQGQLFRLIRRPVQIKSHLLFIAPLFEQANKTRHHITRSANNAYHLGIESIIFDHLGTGDSEGELSQVTLSVWQADILKQIQDIKSNSSKNIVLSVPLSGALLLSTDILNQIDTLILLHADFDGKKFVRQLKRLALVADLSHSPAKNYAQQADAKTHPELLDIAGYQIPASLLAELNEQHISMLASCNVACYWFEWQSSTQNSSLGRVKQQQHLATKTQQFELLPTIDCKFWQASELQLAGNFLAQEQQLFSQLLNMGVGHE